MPPRRPCRSQTELCSLLIPTGPPSLPQVIAAAAVFLCTKVEEVQRSLEDVVMVFYKARNKASMPSDQIEQDLRDAVRRTNDAPATLR